MHCPRCKLGESGASGPYRQNRLGHAEHPLLQREAHEAGIDMDRCPYCGGVWLDSGELQRIEVFARDHKKNVDSFEKAVGQVRRAFSHAHRPSSSSDGGAQEPEPLVCPACGAPMLPREWSIGTLVDVDICLDCRGIWLDPGELETLVSIFSE